MIVMGAGMAGLLAGGMIRNQKVTIYEAAKNLPNNHSAVLRFRSSIVGDVLGIEFKSVQMMKTVHPWKNPVADNLAYSLKCNGKATLRSIITADSALSTRYIAPMNLIKLMSERINGTIEFNRNVTSSMIKTAGTPIISTIPMPTMMDLLAYPDKPNFNYVNGFNINAGVKNMDAYASVYVPDPAVGFNRVSATGDRLTVEYSMPDKSNSDISEIAAHLNENPASMEDIALKAAKFIGISEPNFEKITVSAQKYSKILPIDEGIRRRFIMWASEQHNVYSLGRFATWRPGLLLDDLVNDVRTIQRINSGGIYEHLKK